MFSSVVHNYFNTKIDHDNNKLNVNSLLFFISFEGVIGTAEFVPQCEERAIVPDVMRMMIIMNLSTRTEGEVPKRHEPEVVPRMTIHRLCYPNTHPQPHCIDMTPKEQWSSKERYASCHEVFNRMCVLK